MTNNIEIKIFNRIDCVVTGKSLKNRRRWNTKKSSVSPKKNFFEGWSPLALKRKTE